MKNTYLSTLSSALLLALSFAPPQLPAETVSIENAIIPHVSNKARDSFHNAYLFAEEYKAFAIAPGGAWFWRSDRESAEEAAKATLTGCQKLSRQKCVLFAENDKVVFDPVQWPRLWRPYMNQNQAMKTKIGAGLGQRFYNLSLKKNGKRVNLSDYRGKVVVLHFWGSWCPTCCGELPSLQRLYDALKTRPKDVEFVLVQVREPIETSQEWIRDQKLALPLHDSGYSEKMEDSLQLANGKQIPNLSVGAAFPTTYVLDKNGVVVFSHMGAILKWPEYQPFIEDVIEHSNK